MHGSEDLSVKCCDLSRCHRLLEFHFFYFLYLQCKKNKQTKDREHSMTFPARHKPPELCWGFLRSPWAWGFRVCIDTLVCEPLGSLEADSVSRPCHLQPPQWFPSSPRGTFCSGEVLMNPLVQCFSFLP